MMERCATAVTSKPLNRERPPLPNLTIQQLEYLVAVSMTDTWSEAAASVGVSQSALSQGVNELQRRLGVTLFERRGRRQVMLPAGDEVLRHARAVLSETGDLARWAQELRAGQSGVLRVGMIDAAAVHHFGDVLHGFREQQPSVELRLSVGPSSSLIEQLDSGQLDLLVVVRPRRELAGVAMTPLLREPLALYAPDGARAGKPATWGPWVSFPQGSHTRAHIAAALAELGADFEVVAESHQPEVLREMVRLGMGWTVLPAVQAEAPPHPLVRARKAPIATRELVLMNRTSGVLSRAGELLVEQLERRH